MNRNKLNNENLNGLEIFKKYIYSVEWIKNGNGILW
jgi:hypothetical protein